MVRTDNDEVDVVRIGGGADLRCGVSGDLHDVRCRDAGLAGLLSQSFPGAVTPIDRLGPGGNRWFAGVPYGAKTCQDTLSRPMASTPSGERHGTPSNHRQSATLRVMCALAALSEGHR